ncbi:MAG TPA: HAMP domain-containing sensor histidine kinase [Acidimicrobiia bacterium]|nr:HAMP domain-containing sensor histidine kinase [Acidimicrobiia bacterium]
MRRQVNWLVLAVTSLVVVAFVIPLGLLVRRQAEDRAQVAAEQRAQSVAAALAVAVSSADGNLSEEVAESALVADAMIFLPSGVTVGTGPVFPDVVTAVAAGATSSLRVPGGDWAIGLPVATPAGIVAVVAVAEAEELRAGVWQATALLAALAVALVGGALLLADRLGRSLVEPVTSLAAVAGRLADGDLSARAQPAGPPEMQRVAAALNGLAARLGGIIEGEREALADLSHRLRTPLTALRLQAERSGDDHGRQLMVEQVDRTQAAVDQLIRQVRERGSDPGPRQATSDLGQVVGTRLEFWSVLARNQRREVEVSFPTESVTVSADASEIAAALDVLIGNVFTHTPEGTPFRVEVRAEGATPVLEVADSGSGFGDRTELMERGKSGAGSTGLGLDIVRSLCERLGGYLEMGEGPAGGALVVARLGR